MTSSKPVLVFSILPRYHLGFPPGLPSLSSGFQTILNSLGSLLSLGLMQRMYEGSLEMRISRRLLRLFLNWVPTCRETEWADHTALLPIYTEKTGSRWRLVFQTQTLNRPVLVGWPKSSFRHGTAKPEWTFLANPILTTCHEPFCQWREGFGCPGLRSPNSVWCSRVWASIVLGWFYHPVNMKLEPCRSQHYRWASPLVTKLPLWEARYSSFFRWWVISSYRRWTPQGEEDPYLFGCSWIPLCPAQHLAHSRCSMNVCQWTHWLLTLENIYLVTLVRGGYFQKKEWTAYRIQLSDCTLVQIGWFLLPFQFCTGTPPPPQPHTHSPLAPFCGSLARPPGSIPSGFCFWTCSAPVGRERWPPHLLPQKSRRALQESSHQCVHDGPELFALGALEKEDGKGASLVVQWLRLSTSTAEGEGSNPGWGTRIPSCRVWYGQKMKTEMILNCLFWP